MDDSCDEIAEQLNRNFFVVIDGFLLPEQTRELQAVTDHFIELSRQDSYEAQCLRYAGDADQPSSLFDLEPEHTAERPLPRRLNSPVGSHECYRAAMHNPVMLDIAEQLLGPSGIRL